MLSKYRRKEPLRIGIALDPWKGFDTLVTDKVLKVVFFGESRRHLLLVIIICMGNCFVVIRVDIWQI